MKIVYGILCFAVTFTLSRCANEKNRRKPAENRNTIAQGRTLDVLGPLLGLGLSALRPSRPFGGQFVHPGYSGAYGVGSGFHGAAPHNELYGFGQYSNGYRPAAGPTATQQLFNNLGYHTGAAGFRPNRYPDGYGVGYFPSGGVYGGQNPFSSYQKPFNGSPGSMGSAAGVSSLNSAQAAKLGYALATSLKPFIAAAGGSTGATNQFSSLLQLLGG